MRKILSFGSAFWIYGICWAGPAAPSAFFSDLENFRKQSLSLQTEQQNLEATSTYLNAKRLFWSPTLNLSAVQTQSGIKANNSNPNATNQVVDQNYLQADLNWNLFRGGGDWNSFQSARAKQKAQEFQLLNERLQVEVKASDLIFKSLYLGEVRRIQEQFYKMKQESHQIVNDRYQQGKSPLQEATKSEVDLVQQKTKLRNADLDLAENRAQVGSQFISELKTQAWPFADWTSVQMLPAEESVFSKLKYWRSQSLEEDWRQSKGSHWPSLDFSLQYQQLPLVERNASQWLGTLQLSLPIWTRLESSAKIATNYALYISAENEFKQVTQNAKQRAIFLGEKIEIARNNLLDAKKNLEKSRGLYRDILRSFKVGRISTNDLFIEQNRLLDSENSLAVGQLNFHQELVEVCALAGQRLEDCFHASK